MNVALVLLLVAGLAAIVARLRMWYYDRRETVAIRQELALKDELHEIRCESVDLFWQLGEAQC